MSSQFTELQQKKYRIIRGASHGADLSLVSSYDGYHAAFECAAKVAAVLGPSMLKDFSGVPACVIPLPEMYKACKKLSEHHSVAILDHLPNEKNNLVWGLVWKIERTGEAPSYSLDDF